MVHRVFGHVLFLISCSNNRKSSSSISYSSCCVVNTMTTATYLHRVDSSSSSSDRVIIVRQTSLTANPSLSTLHFEKNSKQPLNIVTSISTASKHRKSLPE